MDLRELALQETEAPTERHPWEDARIGVVYDMVNKLLGWQNIRQVMDIGCGDSYVASELHRRSPTTHYTCVDTAFTPTIVQQLQNTFPNSSIQYYNDLAQVPAVPAVDLVLLMDVIEHVADDAGILRAAQQHAVMHANSHLLVTVPAYQWLFTSHDVFLGHYRRYTQKSLCRVLHDTGWHVADSGYFFSSLLLPRFFKWVTERLQGKRLDATQTSEKGLSVWQPNRLKYKVLLYALKADYALTKLLHRMGITLPGLSVYAICKRSV